MVTPVEAVLRRHGYAMSEDTLAEHLDALLAEPRDGTVGFDMSAADTAYLAEYSGVRQASEADLALLEAHSLGRAAAEAGRTMTRGQVAELLGVDPSRVSHQVSAGRLFSYHGNGGRPAFPDWQFIGPTDNAGPGTGVVPHLRSVIAAIPGGSHPITIRAFMTTPSSELMLRGTAVSPLEWLRGGGAPKDVADLAGTLGEQV